MPGYKDTDEQNEFGYAAREDLGGLALSGEWAKYNAQQQFSANRGKGVIEDFSYLDGGIIADASNDTMKIGPQ